jgi:hypothetical protein
MQVNRAASRGYVQSYAPTPPPAQVTEVMTLYQEVNSVRNLRQQTGNGQPHMSAHVMKSPQPMKRLKFEPRNPAKVGISLLGGHYFQVRSHFQTRLGRALHLFNGQARGDFFQQQSTRRHLDVGHLGHDRVHYLQSR